MKRGFEGNSSANTKLFSLFSLRWTFDLMKNAQHHDSRTLLKRATVQNFKTLLLSQHHRTTLSWSIPLLVLVLFSTRWSNFFNSITYTEKKTQVDVFII